MRWTPQCYDNTENQRENEYDRKRTRMQEKPKKKKKEKINKIDVKTCEKCWTAMSKKARVALKNIDILFMNNLFWNTLIFGFMRARRAYIHTHICQYNVEKDATMWNGELIWDESERETRSEREKIGVLKFNITWKLESALLQLKPHDMCVLMHLKRSYVTF